MSMSNFSRNRQAREMPAADREETAQFAIEYGKRHSPGEVDNASLLLLLLLPLGAYTIVAAASDALTEAIRRLADAASRAKRAARALEQAEARQQEASRRQTAAEDRSTKVETMGEIEGSPERRDRRLIPRWLPLVVLAAGSLIESTFLAAVLASITDAPSLWSAEGLPGLLIGAFLGLTGWVAGLLLGQAHARHADRRDYGDRSRLPRPSWRLGAATGLLLLPVIAIWSYLRAVLQAAGPGAVPVPPGAVVLLMLLVSLIGVLVKTLSVNPYATVREAAGKELRAARAAHEAAQADVQRLQEAKELAADDQVRAWLTLDGQLGAVDQRIEEQHLNVIKLLLQVRSVGGHADGLPPALSPARRDAIGQREGTQSVWSPTDVAVSPLFADLPLPQPHLPQLEQARKALHHYAPPEDTGQAPVHRGEDVLSAPAGGSPLLVDPYGRPFPVPSFDGVRRLNGGA